VGEKNILQRTLGSQLTLPPRIWTRLSSLWILNFIAVGGLNIWVAKTYSEATWVSYKLYSSIGFTVAMMILTIAIVSPHLKHEQDTEESL
jgi:intracellular septation protein